MEMTFTLKKSEAALIEARQYLPGGVNSPVRSFRGVGGVPPFIASAKGSRMTDIDGNEYIDYVQSWGPMIVGHAHPQVTEALHAAIERGTSYGAPTLLETELAKLVREAMPSVEMVRMVNSGTEAVMSVLRVARAYTKRTKVVKFAGCYHGHHDSLLVKAGSGVTTLGLPDSPGVPASVAGVTITVNYNDIDGLEAAFKAQPDEIAAVIIEPVAGNMGMILPREGYLAAVREICDRYGALLVFDEVMTGFRVAYGGAQSVYGIKPDLTTLGKVIGGGMPVGAYGGRRDIIELIAPAGPVYQAGTLSGNPLAMTAGIATLEILRADKGVYEGLEKCGKTLVDGMKSQAASYGIPFTAHNLGSMFGMFFTDKPVYDYESAKSADTAAFNIYFHEMLRQGVYLAPSAFEAGFMSLAHSDEDIRATLAASDKAFARVRESKS